MTLRSVQRSLLGLTVIGLVLIVASMALVINLYGVEALETGVQQLNPILLWWRMLVFLILIGGWPIWVSTAKNRGWIDVSKQTELASDRWYCALWLLLLEVFLNQGLLEFVVNLILAIS